MRINALGNTATDFSSDDYIAIDGATNASRKMKNDSLLKVTAQNTLVGNIAPSFDPSRTASNKYVLGEKAIYDGKIKIAVNEHYGAYNSANFGDFSIETGNTTKEGDKDLYIDASFNVVQNAAFYGSLVKVKNSDDGIFVINNSGSYAIRIAFLESDSLIAGNPAPMAEDNIYVVNSNQSENISIPYGTEYIYIWTYTKFGAEFKISSSGKVRFYTLDGYINSSGVITSNSNYTTYVYYVSSYAGKYLKLNLSNNYFTFAYACNVSKIDIGTTLDLLADSEIGIISKEGNVFVPIPVGTDYIVTSAYTHEGGGVKSYDLTETREKSKSKFNLHTIDFSDPTTKIMNGNGGEFGFGDELIVSVVGTYNASLADIRLTIRLASAYTEVGYLGYGYLKFSVNTPLLPNFRLIFNGDSGIITYTTKLGFWQNYDIETFRFASINAGCFDHGETISPTTTDAEGPEFVETWQTMLKSIGADIIGFCEWNSKMTTTNNFPPKRKLLNCYQNVHEKITGTGSGYNKKAIASIYESKDFEYVVYNNQGSAIPRAFFYEKIQLNGKEIYIVETHLELIAAYRALQIAELISFFSDKEFVVIGGDFNAADASEYDLFTKAGYDIANCGMWGLTPTYIGNSISPASDTQPNDNIAVKGLKIKNIGYYGDVDATDHKAVFADIYFIDN